MAGGRNYERKGSAFDKKVKNGQWSGTVMRLVNTWTGRTYYKKVRAEQCFVMDVETLRDELGGSFTWHSQTIALKTAPAGKGVKTWLKCPRCDRAVPKVYCSPWDNFGNPSFPMVGCRSCLGLTHWSQQNHKTPAWAGRVLGWQPTPYRRNSIKTIHRAADQVNARNTRFIEQQNKKLEKALERLER